LPESRQDRRAATILTSGPLAAFVLLIALKAQQDCTRGIAMSDYGRRIVVNLDFETAVCETNRLLRQEGLKVIARVDIRDHFWGDRSPDFRRYLLIDAWSSALAADALRHNLDVGPILPITFAIYELTDVESVVVVKEPLEPYASNAIWRRDFPDLATMADEEAERVACVLTGLTERSRGAPSISPAA